MASQIRSQRYLAYNTASNLHNRKFLTLLDNLKNPSSANTSENNSPNGSSDQRNRTTNLNSTDNNNTSSSNNVTTSKPNLVTDLTSNLNAQEIFLLSKGPKFSLSPGISEHTITGINIAFYRLANQIRWKHFRESRFQPTDFLTYPQSRHIYKPESEDELERKLQRIHHKLQTTLKELQPQRKWSNISHAEKKVIKELKEKNYICLPSDKGTEFCVIQQDTYTRVALAHLNDSSTYQKIPRMSAKTVENKDIPVRVAHKSYTLRRALSRNNKERTCTRANCSISGTKLCLLRNAVYQITCNNCNQHYIGSTIRFIHDRVKEHLNNDNSSVKKHLSQCQNKVYKGIEIKSIVLENDPANLRLLEAFYIRKYKPTMNSREECSEFADLLF